MSPTLNVMDNTGDKRATVLIFDTGGHGDGIRVTEETTPTLQARMGTGGNNTPMVAYESNVIAFAQNQRDEVRNLNDVAGALQAEPGMKQQTFIAYSVREDATANNFSATELKVSNALNAMRPSPQSHHAQTFIAQPPIVRRLTPTECERLQGFPDGWTTHRVDEKKGLVQQADSARYKQMGNAVAVPVVEWIMARLVEVDSAN